MAETFKSKWLVISGGPNYGTAKSDKRAFGTSDTPIPKPSRNQNGAFGTSGTPISKAPRNHTDLNIDSPTTWPEYLVRLHGAALAEGGENLARRQVEVEVAFWRDAEAQGWHPITTQPTWRSP